MIEFLQRLVPSVHGLDLVEPVHSDLLMFFYDIHDFLYLVGHIEFFLVFGGLVVF
jgi:hypothetical protein